MTGVQRLLETGLIISSALAIFLLTALFTFHPADPGWSQTGHTQDIQNAAGAIGAWVADILLFTFGIMAYLLPVAVMGFGYLLFRRAHQLNELDWLGLGLRMIGVILFMVGTTALSSMNLEEVYYFSAGGLLGDVVSTSMLPYFNFIGTTLLLLAFVLSGITLMTGISWISVIDSLGAAVIRSCSWVVGLFRKSGSYSEKPAVVKQRVIGKSDEGDDFTAGSDETSGQSRTATKARRKGLFKSLLKKLKREKQPNLSEQDPEDWDDLPLASGTATEPFDDADDLPSMSAKDDLMSDDELWSDIESDRKPAQATTQRVKSGTTPSQNTKVSASQTKKRTTLEVLPSIGLLDRPNRSVNPMTREELDEVSRAVEAVLKDFNVDVTVAGVQPGPVITRFELDLAPGVKVSKISNLSKDIARSLSALAVRVVEVIPGKSYVGLEIPNKHREIVPLSEVLGSESFTKSASPLTMVLGKDIAGKPVVVDLAKMPHLLVAGTTGSGKSVGINVMILSLLYKSQPEDVRLIMIDPKMLELSVYEGIPHLLTEVVTDMKDASNALRWCVGEMERRYKLMSALGVRNIKGYNAKVKDAIDAGEPLRNPIWKPGDSMDERPPELEKLPYIVVVVDEFADMIMIVGKKVEELIARIAQKARAAGIHLVLATQRPSVDVITGLIKANIPTRIAFQVSSKVDSRTILDQPGADQLLGQGDMLYLPPGSGVPTRVHGAFVDDHEVHAVVADWKSRGTPQYLEEVLNGDTGEASLLPGEQLDEDGESDPLYDEAVAFVTETRRVSVSSVQRKFRIGYNRAARIVEQMEQSGVVTPAGSNGAREVIAQRAPGG